MNFFPALVLSDWRLRSISEDKLSAKASITNIDTKNLNIKRVPVELVKCTKEMLKNFRGNFYDYSDETFETFMLRYSYCIADPEKINFLQTSEFGD